MVARSRNVAKSGTKPVNQNRTDTVKYVETANTSHMSALRKFCQMPQLFGIGAIYHAIQNRPTWMPGKIAAHVRAGASSNTQIPRDSFTTACAQACPTEAIVFGDIKDPKSDVSKMKQQDRNYRILDYLNVIPRTSYLARLRNPNLKMPDAKDVGIASLVETLPE